MLEVVSILGFSSFQDMGRNGFRSLGLSRSGAADYYAMAEGAALLDQSPNSTALELIGNGGTFNVLEDCMVALTGATMLASADQKPLAWNASHYLYKGNMLNLTTQQNGRYSYLHLRGGFKAPKVFNSCSAQPVAGIGQYTRPKDILAQLENKQDPIACQKIEPAASSCRWKRSISRPRRRWSRLSASSNIVKWDVSSFSERQTVP